MSLQRLLVVVLAVTIVATAACGGDDGGTATVGESPAETTTSTSPGQTVEPGQFDPANEGTLLTWSETAGECQVCGFSIVFDASGIATYEGYRTRSTVDFDATELQGRMERLDHQPLTDGTDDCMREVDGNAPVLELFRADGTVLTVDDCHEPIDRSHPIMQFVTDALAAAEAIEAAALADVTDQGGRCPDGTCLSMTSFYDDGTVVRTSDGGAETESSLTADDVAELRSLVERTDLDDLVVGDFTGSCPTEVDGRERTYVIGGDAENEPIRLASCRDELDPDAPLLVLLDRLVGTAVSG